MEISDEEQEIVEELTRPRKAIFGHLKKKPAGVGDGSSESTRKRATLALKKEVNNLAFLFEIKYLTHLL